MDVLERVRDVDAGERLSEDRIGDARSRLLERIDAGPVSVRNRRLTRPVLLIAGVVAGAAAATAAVVIANQPPVVPSRVEVAPVETRDPAPPTPQPTPDPGNTSGAGVAAAFPGTVPQPGQYLRVAVSVETLLYRDDRIAVYDWGHAAGLPPISALLVRDRGETFIPADRSSSWRLTSGPSGERVRFFPEDQGPAGELAWQNLLPPRSDVHTEDRSAEGHAGDWSAEMPSEPQALIDQIRLQPEIAGQDPALQEESVTQEIVDRLRSNSAVPADRAVLLEALALRGVEEVGVAPGNLVTYRMMYPQSGRRTDTITIDTATGWAREYTMRYDREPGEDGDMVPGDVPDIRMTYTVGFVAAAP